MNMMIIDLDNDGVIMFTKMSRSIFFVVVIVQYTQLLSIQEWWWWIYGCEIQFNSFRLVDGSIDIIIGIICA